MIKYDEPVYQKVGKRYKEVGKWVEFDCLPHGAHLVVVNPGLKSTLFNVDVDKAGFLAAAKIAKEAMLKAMMDASDLRPKEQTAEITQEQRDLLDKLKSTGFMTEWWIRNSLNDIVDAGIKAVENNLK